jgi:hypothetical protein
LRINVSDILLIIVILSVIMLSIITLLLRWVSIC